MLFRSRNEPIVVQAVAMTLLKRNLVEPTTAKQNKARVVKPSDPLVALPRAVFKPNGD